MKLAATATIPIQEMRQTPEGPRIRKQRMLSSGKDVLSVSGEHVVTLHELGDDHASEMAYELRITHPHPDDKSPDEMLRFADEKTARAHFELYVTVLCKQNHVEPGQFMGETLAGRVAKDNDPKRLPK